MFSIIIVINITYHVFLSLQQSILSLSQSSSTGVSGGNPFLKLQMQYTLLQPIGFYNRKAKEPQ